MKKSKKIKLPVNKLLVGLMVDLELSWTQHPFLFSKFKIRSQDDIAIIKQLNLKEITVFPEQSDVQPPEKTQENNSAPTEPEPKQLSEKHWKSKHTKIEEADRFRKKRQQVAKKYEEQASKMRRLTRDLKTQPANAIHDAIELVDSMAAGFDEKNTLLTNLVNLGAGRHSMYNHCINVTILSMNLASSLGIKGDELKLLARGALLHDIGKVQLPDTVVNKTGRLTSAEQGVYQQHSQIGHRLCQRVEDTPEEVLKIVELHHEFLDGSGFPYGYKKDKIPEIVHIVAIANIYDKLCNPNDPKKALTPKAALATLYSKYKDKLDHRLVKSFISTLGVYPPGSVVRLSNGSFGLVVTVNPKEMLKPEVLLYNPDIPQLQALSINLQEQPDLTISKVLKPGDYPKRVYEYLGIEERLGFMTCEPF